MVPAWLAGVPFGKVARHARPGGHAEPPKNARHPPVGPYGVASMVLPGLPCGDAFAPRGARSRERNAEIRRGARGRGGRPSNAALGCLAARAPTLRKRIPARCVVRPFTSACPRDQRCNAVAAPDSEYRRPPPSIGDLTSAFRATVVHIATGAAHPTRHRTAHANAALVAFRPLLPTGRSAGQHERPVLPPSAFSPRRRAFPLARRLSCCRPGLRTCSNSRRISGDRHMG
jgi:hypothetical protein